MRGSALILPVAAAASWLAAVAWPATAAVVALSESDRVGVPIRHSTELLLTSCLWAALVAVAAAGVGYAPGRFIASTLLRPSSRRWPAVVVVALTILPVAMPSYLAYWCWYQAWPEDSALFAWAARTGHIRLVKDATLLVGLVCWSWPIVAWTVAASSIAGRGSPGRWDELLRLDRAAWFVRVRHRIRRDGPAMLIGMLLVFLVCFNSTTSFDLADRFTFANELRAIAAVGASEADILVAAWPAMAVALFGAVATWGLLCARASGAQHGAVERMRPARAVATAGVWLLSVAAPAWFLLRHLARLEQPFERFFRFGYGEGLLDTCLLALVCGGVGAVLTLGLAMLWQSERAWARRLGDLQAMGWLFAMFTPAAVIALGHTAAYNRAVLGPAIYEQPAILVLANLTSFGAAAALFARWAVATEPRRLADVRRLDHVNSLRARWKASRPRFLAAAIASGALLAVLSLGEVQLTSRLQPPGFQPLAQTILNAMHYQRPDTVMTAAVAMMAAATIAAMLVALAWCVIVRWSAMSRSIQTMLLLFVAVVLLPACGRGDMTDSRPLRPVRTFGSPGYAPGQFSYPRPLAVDPDNKRVYVIDKSARVQRFNFEGEQELEWKMPDWEQGKPVGLSVGPDGTVWVPDTHYFRVIAYSPDGKELLRFGSYGTEVGQFIYPTDIAFGPNQTLYVAEYGGNDRVQVFTETGEFLFAFGSIGSGVGEFNRPEAIAFNAEKSELFIADACNHRVLVLDPQGKPLRTFGRPGRGPGELMYPYDICVLEDGSLLVCEFGNNRMQRFTDRGELLGVYGQFGAGAGQLQYPWSVDVGLGLAFVVDSGNNRVQVVRIP